MTGEISSNHDALIQGSGSVRQELAAPVAKSPAPAGVDPRLAALVIDAADQNEKGRDNVRAGAEKTDKHTKGLAGLQEENGRKIRGVGDHMPTMPVVPQSAEAPMGAQPAAVPPPQAVMAAPPAPGAQLAAPAGLSSIDPAVLSALVAAVQQQAASDAAVGIYPTADSALGSGVELTPGSAVTPQNPQPLDVSQVSLAQYPGGQLTREQTAAVIDQALTINGIPNDPTIRARWHELYQHMADGESSRVPNAVNTWDSNATGPRAADGAPANSSRGIWQCIPSTFAAYHMAGTSNSIYDPLASAAASINYVMDRYDVGRDGSNLAAFASARGLNGGFYRGY